MARTSCAHCAKSLTEAQQNKGNTYCSSSCSYKAYLGNTSTSKEWRPYKQRSLRGGIRPLDVPRGTNGLPLAPVEERPEGPWFIGPLRLKRIVRRYYFDGTVEDYCPICYRRTLTLSDGDVWCSRCAVLVAVYEPEPKAPKRIQFAEPELFKVCPICSAMHARVKYCSDECCREANARQNRDRYRQRVGLPIDPSQPTRPHRRKGPVLSGRSW